jgi:hypothetical protein
MHGVCAILPTDRRLCNVNQHNALFKLSFYFNSSFLLHVSNVLCSSSVRLYCTYSLIRYVFHAFMQAVYQVEWCARYVSNDTLLLILHPLAFITFGPSHQNSGLKIVALYLGILYKETEENCSGLMAISNYLCWAHVHVTECNVLSVCIYAVIIIIIIIIIYLTANGLSPGVSGCITCT